MMLFVGIDIGSTAVKAALWNGTSFDFAVRPTGWNPKESGEEAIAELLLRAQKTREDIQSVAATGYGRKTCDFADKKITEITCHAGGAACLLGVSHDVLDIGGQDSKVIVTEPDGTVANFLMNDKCAAGTGRFLQNMAVLLEYSMEDFAAIPTDVKPVSINSMCTVFAESEVIGLLSKGTPKESVALGLLDSVALRASSMLSRISSSDSVTFTGGLAQNTLLAELISKHTGRRVVVPSHAQFAGAVGAALLAAKEPFIP